MDSCFHGYLFCWDRNGRGTGSRGQGSLAPQRRPVLSPPPGTDQGASAGRSGHTTSEGGREGGRERERERKRVKTQYVKNLL